MTEESKVMKKKEEKSKARLSELEEQGKKDSLLLKQKEDRRFSMMNEKGNGSLPFPPSVPERVIWSGRKRNTPTFPWQ